jgi:hypothetical protein
MFGKVILWLTAIAFVPYGLACFFWPDLPAGYAGLALTNGNAVAEISAMYGGLQTGFGLFCALAALRQEYFRAGLVLLILCLGLLSMGRFYQLVIGGQTVGAYTYGAMFYEFTTAILAAFAVSKESVVN